MQVLKLEIALPEAKVSSVEEAQMLLQKEQLRREIIKLKLNSESDVADRKEIQEKLNAEIEMQARKNKFDQQCLAIEAAPQECREAIEA